MKIQYQIDDFIDYCVAKGLSKKTYSSYEQTLIPNITDATSFYYVMVY